MKSKFFHHGKDVLPALSADLPAFLRSIGRELIREGPYRWRVPGHGGLILKKSAEGFWKWFCFSTHKGGDAISFLREFEGMNTLEAIRALLRHSSTRSGIGCTYLAPGKPQPTMYTTTKIKPVKLPPDPWREKAQKLVTVSKMKLWENPDTAVWSWLHNRGLNDETIRKANLGWISKNYWQDREDWGLETQVDDSGNNKRLWLPTGLLIPITDPKNGVVGLSVRRFSEEGPKYYNLPGSSLSPLILGEIERPVAICETLLDAWLIHQEAGDIITAAALGSCGAKPDTRLATHLVVAPKILVCLDADGPGRDASKWWTSSFRNAVSWPVPWGKDPADCFGTIPNLIKMWLQFGL